MIHKRKIDRLVYAILLLTSACLAPEVAISQVNIKIGYAGAYALTPETNQLISQYNTANQAILNTPMSLLHWMHGIEMGLRYNWQALNFEMSWESKGNTISSVEVNDNNIREKSLYFRLNSLVLGSEIQLGKVGLGATVEQGYFKIDSDLLGTSKRDRLTYEYPLSSKVFVSIHLPGTDYMSFVIRPYYGFQWTRALDLEPVADFLAISSIPGIKEKFGQIGISFCFFNGVQRQR